MLAIYLPQLIYANWIRVTVILIKTSEIKIILLLNKVLLQILICEADISCRIYLPYIHLRQICCEFPKMLTKVLAISLGVFLLDMK